MKPKKAFTLIELLVVIAIIGLLATISVIALNNARAKARDAKRVADIKQVQTALELFFNDKGRYPTTGEFTLGSLFSTSTSGTTTYMAILPAAANPPDGNCTTNQNTFIYTGSSDGTSYTISYCIGGTVGSLTTGPHCATPAGIADGTSCAGGGGSSFSCGDSVSYGGESYPTVSIGTQCWFAKNLDIGTRVDSAGASPCIDVEGSGWDWSCQVNDSVMEKYCYQNTDSYCTTDGGLYEWAEALQLPYQCNYTNYACNGTTCVSTEHSPACDYPDPTATKRQGICPSGWHIPSDDEWTTLTDYLSVDGQGGSGDANDVGGKLKEAGTTHWNSETCDDGNPPTAVCNSSNFTALPAGGRGVDGSFNVRGYGAGLWSSLPYSGFPGGAWDRGLGSGGAGPYRGGDYRAFGFSVRCVQD